MTGDLAWQLLRHGLRPGRVVALVGGSGDADDLAAAMIDAGARVIRLAGTHPTHCAARSGSKRSVPEDRWLEADTLVLADRLLPQAFVLRGLGLMDARPGVPAPADGDGRLPLEGLWAAGCSVNPSLDHRTCAEQGRLVGRGAAMAVARDQGILVEPTCRHPLSELLRDRAVIRGSPSAVWALIEDPAALARVLPGAELIVATGEGRFHGVLASKVQFLTVRADVDAVFRDADPPRHLRLELAGRPRGLAGSFTVSVPFDLTGTVEPGRRPDPSSRRPR